MYFQGHAFEDSPSNNNGFEMLVTFTDSFDNGTLKYLKMPKKLVTGHRAVLHLPLQHRWNFRTPNSQHCILWTLHRHLWQGLLQHGTLNKESDCLSGLVLPLLSDPKILISYDQWSWFQGHYNNPVSDHPFQNEKIVKRILHYAIMMGVIWWHFPRNESRILVSTWW